MEKTFVEQIQINKSNKICGLHPKTKLVILISYSICSFIFMTLNLTNLDIPILVIPWFFVLPILALLSGILKQFLKGFKVIFPVSMIVFLVQLFLIPGGAELWRFYFLSIYQGGLKSAINLTFMITNIAGIFLWYFQTTTNQEISRALEESGMNYKAAFVFTSSLKMIDVLGKNSRTIMNAQQARGVETEGNLLVRAKAFFPSMVPLILGAVINADEKALTLEARGFNYQCKKTRLFNLKKSGWEKQVTLISIGITIIVLGWRILWQIM